MLGVEKKVVKAARTAAAFTVSGLLAVVGIAFITLAAWIVLVDLRSPLFAASIIGMIYLGLSAVVAAYGAYKPSAKPPEAEPELPQNLSPMQMMAVSFIQGLEQGRQARRT